MKFIHIADVHLGAVPDRGYPWSEERGMEIWENFQQVIRTVGEEKTDLLLISGDLFHRQPLLRELKEVNYLFSTIPDTRVVLIAGNHDYLKKGSYYLTFSWSENVLPLFGKEVERVFLEELSTCVYGLSYYSQEMTERLYDSISPSNTEGRYHILLAHGGDEKHIPFQKNTAGLGRFDYVALGHIHKPQILIPGKMAYAGSLTPLDRNETGRHGYIKGECSSEGTHLCFVPCASRFYIPLLIRTEPKTTQYQLEEMIRREISAQGSHHIYQIFLEGFRDAEVLFDKKRLLDLGNVLEVMDDTQADYNLGAIYEEYKGSLIGEYIGHFLEKDRTVVEEKALYYGLDALFHAMS